MPETSHAASPAPQQHPAQTRKQNRSWTLLPLLVTAGLAGGAVLLLVEVVLLVLPPAICQGAAGAPGSAGAAGDVAEPLPGYSPAAATLIELPGACRAGQFTIPVAIRVDQAGLTAATADGGAPGLPPASPGQDPAAGDHVRWSHLQLVQVRAGPGSRPGTVHDPSGHCGISGRFAMVQLVTSGSGETALALIVSSQPPAERSASQAAAPPTAGQHS